jgi:hypothetical protein
VTAWTSDVLRKVYADGFPVRAVLYLTSDISANDTVDAAGDFTEVLAASLVVIRSNAAVACPVVSGKVTIPLLGSTNVLHDAGWLTVIGTAR